jgi:serine phosphatase RsbU (regulator of sigma subunit)/DNA-binding LacI/PurR family transcriptional regulator
VEEMLKIPTIGAIIEGLDGPYHTELYRHLRTAALDRGVHFVACTGGCFRPYDHDAYSQEREEAVFALTALHKFDGLIVPNSVYNISTNEIIESFARRHTNVPIVTIGFLNQRFPLVEADNFAGMEELLLHLITDHGARRFIFIRVLEAEEADYTDRWKAFCRIQERFGLAPEDQKVYFTAASGWAESVAHDLRRAPPRQWDAIICLDDQMAIKLNDALQGQGIRVPNDILLTGFDDLDAYFSIPALTTCRQPFKEMCEGAVDLLLQKIAGKPVPQLTRIPTTMVRRQSCGCAWEEPIDRIFSGTGQEQPDGALDDAAIISRAVALLTVADQQAFAESASVLSRELLKCQRVAAKKADSGTFIKGLDVVLRLSVKEGMSPLLWQRILTGLSRGFAKDVPSRAARNDFGPLIEQAYRYIADFARRYDSLRTREALVQSWQQLAITGSLAGARSYADLAEIIVKDAKFLADLEECAVFVLDGGPRSSGRGHLLTRKSGSAYRADGTPASQTTAAAFLASLLETCDRPTAVVAELLRDGLEPVGFAFCQGEPRDLSLFTQLRIFFGNAIKSVGLIEQVRTQAAELGRAHDQLISLRAQEQAYLEAIRRELNLAREIQSNFLPQTIPQLDGWNTAVCFKPAEEVAGDFYDIFPLASGKTAIVVADVCGKSVSAALFMALVRSLVRALSEQALTDDPHKIMSYINDYIIRNHHSSGPYMFVTLYYGVLDGATGNLDYINAGHPPPVIADSTRILTTLRPTGPAIGISRNPTYVVKSVRLAPGETFFAWTDGVTEANNVAGALLGNKKLFSVVESSLHSPQTLIDAVRRAIEEHTRGRAQSDDITMVAIKRNA